ncbi:MAG: mycofactocin-coupled SDR family oxidoreductase [Acidimicrobiia bacterium]
MGKLEGKVAFITGAARGQGRSHAVRLAEEGCDIIAIDICHDVEGMDYSNATESDLAETARLVEALDRRIVARKADVRDLPGLQAAFDEGIAEFGRCDIVLANAGIVNLDSASTNRVAIWRDTIDTNLTGVWHTCEVALPSLVAGGRGGSIVITSSSAGIKGTGTTGAGGAAYTAAKRGLVGLMQVLALAYAEHSIRVNTIHPTGVVSGMTMNPSMERLLASGGPELSSMQNALPIQILEARDISNAIAWLVSDEAYYITGIQLPLDAGFTVR